MNHLSCYQSRIFCERFDRELFRSKRTDQSHPDFIKWPLNDKRILDFWRSKILECPLVKVEQVPPYQVVLLCVLADVWFEQELVDVFD